MKNNDDLKEKAIRANELENVSGGSGDAGNKYAFEQGWDNCGQEFCGRPCLANCPTQAIKYIKTLTRNGRVSFVIIKQELCNGCGICASVCPLHSIMQIN